MSRTPPYITRFEGMRLPSTDFGAVRNDLQIEYLFYEQDLSAAHSIAAGTQILLPLKGNSIYIDQAADVGNATIVFHDQSLSARPGKVFVQPGFNAGIPFDVITIENAAQPGKVLRIFYGVDIDFKPGIAGVVTIPGLVNMADVALLPSSSFVSGATLTANTPLNVLAAASNTAGVRIHDGNSCSVNATQIASHALLAKATAPANAIDGVIIMAQDNGFSNAAGDRYHSFGKLVKPRRIATGLRMDFIVSITDTGGCTKYVNYDVL